MINIFIYTTILVVILGIGYLFYKIYKKLRDDYKQQAFEFWNGGINSTEEGGKSFDQYYKKNYES